MSHVMCDMSRLTIFIFYFFFGQSGEAYRWRVCYRRGLPRLVYSAVTAGINLTVTVSTE